MKVNVEMLAFLQPGVFRPVEVEDKNYPSRLALLEEVFRLGQNDFQPLQFPSLSPGDVAVVAGGDSEEFWMFQMAGWSRLTKAEMDEYRLIRKGKEARESWLTQYDFMKRVQAREKTLSTPAA